jgi:hypothetical protein
MNFVSCTYPEAKNHLHDEVTNNPINMGNVITFLKGSRSTNMTNIRVPIIEFITINGSNIYWYFPYGVVEEQVPDYESTYKTPFGPKATFKKIGIADTKLRDEEYARLLKIVTTNCLDEHTSGDKNGNK